MRAVEKDLFEQSERVFFSAHAGSIDLISRFQARDELKRNFVFRAEEIVDRFAGQPRTFRDLFNGCARKSQLPERRVCGIKDEDSGSLRSLRYCHLYTIV